MEEIPPKELNAYISQFIILPCHQSKHYVTTESHEKRMHVAGQCALRFVGKIRVRYFCFKILGNLKHRRFISTFYTWKGR